MATEADADYAGHPSAWTPRTDHESVVRAVEYNTGGLQPSGTPEAYIKGLRVQAGDSPGRATERIDAAVDADDLLRWTDEDGTTRLTTAAPAALVRLAHRFYARGDVRSLRALVRWEGKRAGGPRRVVVANCNWALEALGVFER